MILKYANHIQLKYRPRTIVAESEQIITCQSIITTFIKLVIRQMTTENKNRQIRKAVKNMLNKVA